LGSAPLQGCRWIHYGWARLLYADAGEDRWSVDSRFVPLNALIAFCSRYETAWPRPFFDAGYRLEALEFPAPSGDSRVVIDAVAWSPADSRFVLGEAKSGANADEAQAKRYATIQTNTLVQMLSVTLTQTATIGSQVLYVVLAEHTDRVLLGLSRAGVSYPVLAIADGSVTRVGGEIEHAALAERFSSPLEVPGPPPGIITIDAESSDEDFDRVVRPSLIALLASQGPAMSVPALAESAIQHLSLYPDGYRNRLVRLVDAAARRAVAAAPDTFAYSGPSGVSSSAIIRVVESPEDLDPRGRTQRYQALTARFTAPARRRPSPVGPGQLSLFDDTSFENELADLDLVEENETEEVNDGPQ
jgi:hypothetical protein